MIKRIFIAVTCVSSLAASEAPTPTVTSAEEATVTTPQAEASEMTPSTARSIEMVILSLERAIILMDDPNRASIVGNLQAVNTVAHNLLIKLMALIKCNKIADYGIETLQVYALYSTYLRFKAKLMSIQNVEPLLEDRPVASEPIVQ